MNSSEEIERAKNNLNRILEDWQKIVDLEDPIARDIESQLYMEEMPFKEIKILLQYIDQLETNNQKLIEKLEKEVTTNNIEVEDRNINKWLSKSIIETVKEKSTSLINEYRKEVLEILKGEKE